MSEKYNEVEDLKDTREFVFGEIWILRDDLISLLPSDRVVNRRNMHSSSTIYPTHIEKRYGKKSRNDI